MKELDWHLSRLLLAQLQATDLLVHRGAGTAIDINTAGINKEYARWLDTSLQLLVEQLLLTHEGSSYALTDGIPADGNAIWKDWEQQKTVWLNESDLKAQVRLVDATLRALPGILTGKMLATDIMFPKSSMELMEGIYKNNRVSDYFNEVLGNTLISFIEETLWHDPDAQLRIFEIGAGSGGTSEGLFQKLQPYKDHIQEYCYTDISRAFLLHAEKEYGPENPYLTYRIFNTEQPAAGQGIVPGTYDVAIATNVLHATTDIHNTLRNAKALLKKNGLLLLNEISTNSLFTHLTFGLLKGWWLYEDPELRIPGCPGLYPDVWQRVLESEGFGAVFFPAEESHPLGQQIIAAESDGVIRQIQAASKSEEEKGGGTVPPPSRQDKSGHTDTGISVHDAPSSARVVDFVSESLILKMSEALKLERTLIDLDKSFADYGLDSIIGVNFVQAVSEILQIELETTDIFDYSSIRRLTEFIVLEHEDAIAARMSGSEPLLDLHVKTDKQEQALIQGGSRSSTVREKDISSLASPAAAANEAHHEPIAIIGMSGRFAKSDNVDAMWEHLSRGDHLVDRISRWDLAQYHDQDASYCDYGSFLDGIDLFDPLFFNISGLEATYMDPQQRIFLEEAWKALENAGYAGAGVSGTRCGVYVGCAAGDYNTLFAENPPPQALWGSLNSAIAARIAYYLNLQGPAIAVDTACSSSLVSVHLACQGLWSGETDMALAGGIYIQATPQYHLLADGAGMLSRTGRCYTFDNRADGMVPGEAAGAVVLKRLRNAIADGDHIYGVIRGSGINQDGTTNGITAPSLKSQERLEREVYDTFGINPAQIQMVEAHGTGTRLGDPIEYHALSRAFRHYTPEEQFCAIGSLKTNIGHTQLASGVAGLIKILLSLQHKQIPASLHFESGNTNIQFTGSPFYVNTSLKDWNVPLGTKRLATISSFGATGTNAHMVIEEAPRVERAHAAKPGYLIALSAQSQEQLRQQAEQLATYSEQQPGVDCGSISYTLLLGRKHFKHRLSCVVRTTDELAVLLRSWLQKGKLSQVYVSEVNENERREQPALKRYGNACIRSCQDIEQANEYREQLSAIAELYTSGYSLEYEELFAEGTYSRIPLPTYPFARERYWVPEKATDSPIAPSRRITPTDVLHPLLHENTSDLVEQRFSSTFTGHEPFLTYRHWNGQRLFPAAAYLEMARAAVELSAGRESHAWMQIRQVRWTGYAAAGDQPLRLHIGLYPEENGSIAYEVYGDVLDDTGEPALYHVGTAVLNRSREEAPALDLSALQAACSEVSTSGAQHEASSRGAAEPDVDAVYAGPDQVLVKLSQPNVKVEGMSLQSALLDVALHAAMEQLYGTAHLSMEMIEMEAMNIYGSCTANMWAWIRPKSDTSGLDLDLCDEEGSVRIRMTGIEMGAEQTVQLLAVTEPDVRQEASHASRGRSEEQEETALLTFEERWQERALPVAAVEQTQEGQRQTLVLFLSAPERQQEVRHVLQQLNPASRVIFISRGPSFSQLSSTHYSVEPHQSDAHQAAWQSIGAEHGEIDAALYLWPLEEAEFSRDYTSLLLLLQGAAAASFPPRRLLLAGRYEDGQERSYLEAWMGLERSLGMAMPDVQTTCIYGEESTREEPDLSAWTQRLWAELQAPKAQSARYEAGRRYVCEVVPKPMPERGASGPFRLGGTYVITGGLGGLGRLFAEQLLKRQPVNLVLIGRSGEDAEKHAQIQALEAAGGRVMYVQADVSDRASMERGLRQARDRFGPLHGVIHAAGLLSNQTLLRQTAAEFSRILAPKIQGTLVLDEVLKEDALDFVCYFSSSSAILGDFGSCNYAMGNRFLMGYADYRNELARQGRRQGTTIAIQWPLWRDGGMATHDSEQTKMYLQASGQRFLEGAEGFSVFERLLSGGSTPTLVLAGQPARIQRFLGLSGTEKETKPASPLLPPASAAASRSSGKGRRPEMRGWSIEQCLEWELKELVSQLLKIPRERVDREANLTDFGFDSISLADFSQEIMNRIGIETTPALFYGYPTLTQLLGYFITDHEEVIRTLYREQAPQPFSAPNPVVQAAKPAPSSVRRRTVRLGSVATAAAQPMQEDIAIIGMSGRFPDARNIDELWTILANGQDVVQEHPVNRFTEDTSRTAKWKGGWVPGVDEFDPLFFGISPKEAEMMDPRQRLLLQESWRALEDAGYGAEHIKQSRIGMFVGVESGDYQYLTGIHAPITSNHDAVLAARLSYFLNLNGPNMSINTACSSGLVAAHQACSSLRSRECDTAIAAGVNLILASGTLAAIQQAGMLSEDGKCYVFDKRANGMVPGEAISAVVLKRLSQAEADGDPIYAVIKGSGINYDGKTNGITSPSGVAQASLLRNVYEQYRLNPEHIEYIVTHGTGTRIGDPIEINALYDTFKSFTAEQGFCALTSTKTNFGHTFAASGLVSLISLVQAMRHETIPASLHCEVENDYINWQESPFYVNKAAKPWTDKAGRSRLGAVSAFGMSGTNAHMVVESYSASVRRRTPSTEPAYLLVLSAKTEESLQEKAKELLHFIQKGEAVQPDWSGISFTLMTGRQHFNYRCAFAVHGREDAIHLLETVQRSEKLPNLFRGQVPRDFNGQKAMYAYIQDLLVQSEVRKGDTEKYLDMLHVLADLYCQGYDIAWKNLHANSQAERLHLPTYPFARGHYWVRELVSAGGEVRAVQAVLQAAQQVAVSEPVSAVPDGGAATKPVKITLTPAHYAPVQHPSVVHSDKPAISLASTNHLETFKTPVPVPPAILPKNEAAAVPVPESSISTGELGTELKLSLAEALGMESLKIDEETSFIDLGLDSIIGVEWIQEINRKYQTSFTASIIYEYPNLRKFTVYLDQELYASGSLANRSNLDSGQNTASLTLDGIRWPTQDHSPPPVPLELPSSVSKPTAAQTPVPTLPSSTVSPVSNQKGDSARIPAITQERLQAELTDSLAEALGIDRSQMDPEANLIDLGLDSIIGVEWIQTINQTYGMALVASVIYDHPTIRSFAIFLASQMQLAQSSEQPAAVQAPDSSLQELLQQVQAGNMDVDQADLVLKQMYLAPASSASDSN